MEKYANCFKEVCSTRHKIKGNEVVSVGKNVFSMLQRKLPSKFQDPSSFTIPLRIGNIRLEKAMLDLGESINDILYNLYASLNLGSLKELGIII